MNIDRLQNNSGNVADAIPTTPRLTRRRTAGRNAGTSLVEVLIVLVIVLIGVFAVIQIFPIGFNTLRRSESRLRADHMARTATETLTSAPDGLPESITFSYWDTTAAGNQLTTITNEDPDNLGTYQDLADNKRYFSDVNKYRYIRNEPIKIPLPNVTPVNNNDSTAFGAGAGSIHFLAFGPIFMDNQVSQPDFDTTASADNAARNNSYLKITSDSLYAIPADSTAPDGSGGDNSDTSPSSRFARLLRGTHSYLIDYGGDDETNPKSGGAYIMFAPSNKDRVFTISFTYQRSDRSVQVQKPVEITIPGIPNQYIWYRIGPGFPIDTTNSITGPTTSGEFIQPGSDVVVRNFTRILNADGWDASDPYQYKLASRNVGASNANMGVIAFNPAGANYSVVSPSGTRPFTALASYATLDWHILRDDREVPAGSGGVARVRTSMPNIRVRGDEFVDFNETGDRRNQIYPGLYPQKDVYRVGIDDNDLPSPVDSPDIQVFNLSDPTGAITALQQGDFKDATTTANNADYWVSKNGRGGTYPSGVLYINTNKVRPGSKIRILYKAQGDWALAFQKASTNYRVNEATGNNGNPTRPAPGITESFGADPMGNGFADDRIYFHRSEINKGATAVIEYDTAAGTTRLPSRQFTITGQDGDYAYVNATDIAPELVKVSGVTGWRVFGNIRGVTLKTRVIWHDEVNGRSPWRISDLETYPTVGAK